MPLSPCIQCFQGSFKCVCKKKKRIGMCDRFRNVKLCNVNEICKSFFLLSCQHELLLNTQGNFANSNQKSKPTMQDGPAPNAQPQRGCIYGFSPDLRFDLECIMFNFSMLQLASERYVWLCVASGEAVTEVHNKRGMWRRFL